MTCRWVIGVVLVLASSALGGVEVESWTESRWLDGRTQTVTAERQGDTVVFRDEQGRVVPRSVSASWQRTWRQTLASRARADIAQGEPRKPAVPVSAGGNVRGSTHRLDRIDLSSIIAEDRTFDIEKGGRRIGVLRKLAPISPSSSGWSRFADGRTVGLVTLDVPGAEGVRVHIEKARLPGGAYLVVYNTDDPTQAYGPFSAADLVDGELWPETVFGSRVSVECVVPAGSDARQAEFQVREIAHVYVPWKELVQPREAGCHNDVSCHPSWTTTSKAVVGLGSIGSSGFLFCTGCLIADSDPGANLNYVLTANHCVRNARQAGTLELYWFFQTSSCNEAAPEALSVPRTSGGADYLAGSTRTRGTDFSLLRLRTAPPAGATYAGWSSKTPAVGSSVAAIHHPDGAYKRISFGSIMGPVVRSSFWSILWSSGVTEPGSSGSPLFNNDQEILGQLYGGTSYCSFPQGRDEFGRFDLSFPVMQPWLRPKAPALHVYEDARDYDGDGKGDIAVYVTGNGNWYIQRSALGGTTFNWGFAGTRASPGDYDGDGKSDAAVYHPASGNWYILRSLGGSSQVQFGYAAALPVSADYDGDGKTDVAVFDVNTAVWYLNRSSLGFTTAQWGFKGVFPVAADYDGDGKADLAVYSPANATWYIVRSTLGPKVQQFGYGSVVPVPRDYDGDGKADIAVFDQDAGVWYYDGTQAGFTVATFGAQGGTPIPLDYDGDARSDFATYYPQSGTWSIRQTTSGDRQVQWGSSGVFPPGVR